MANPDDYTPHRYQFKHISAIDEEKEIDAFARGMEEGVLTKADYHDRKNQDWEVVDDQIKAERIRAIDDRLELEKYEQDQRAAMGLPEMNPDPEPEESPTPSDEQPPNLAQKRLKQQAVYPSLSR